MQINLISRYTLHVGNVRLILLIAYVQPDKNDEVSSGHPRNIDSAYFFEDCSQRFDRNARGDAMLLQFDDPYHTVKRMLTHLGLLDLLHVFTSNAIRVRLFFVFTKAIMWALPSFCRSRHCHIDNFYSKHKTCF